MNSDPPFIDSYQIDKFNFYGGIKDGATIRYTDHFTKFQDMTVCMMEKNVHFL